MSQTFENITDLDIKVGDIVWTMIGNYPYEVTVLRIKDNSHFKPRGTFQKDYAYVWRENNDVAYNGTSHKRYPWQIFKTREDLKNYLFPKL